MGPEMGRHRGSAWPFILVGVSVIALFSGLSEVSQRLGPASIPIWFIAIGGATFALRGPLGKAIADRIAGRNQFEGEDVVAQVPEELYAELDELRARVGELEERVDFSERLLAKQDSNPPA
ncbi:MAG: hypothetical protein ABIZ70_00690 [Gemmatimonadales bacterium]